MRLLLTILPLVLCCTICAAEESSDILQPVDAAIGMSPKVIVPLRMTVGDQVVETVSRRDLILWLKKKGNISIVSISSVTGSGKYSETVGFVIVYKEPAIEKAKD